MRYKSGSSGSITRHQLLLVNATQPPPSPPLKEGKSGPDKAVIRLEPGALNLGNWVGRGISKSDLFCYPMMVALWRGRPPAGWGLIVFVATCS